MSNNFTPLPKTTAHGKGVVDVNIILIIVAIGITIVLGIVMWFLIVQKQKEEKNAETQLKNKVETIETVPGDREPNQQSTPSAEPVVTVQPTNAITPLATGSANINQ